MKVHKKYLHFCKGKETVKRMLKFISILYNFVIFKFKSPFSRLSMRVVLIFFKSFTFCIYIVLRCQKAEGKGYQGVIQ